MNCLGCWPTSDGMGMATWQLRSVQYLPVVEYSGKWVFSEVKADEKELRIGTEKNEEKDSLQNGEARVGGFGFYYGWSFDGNQQVINWWGI